MHSVTRNATYNARERSPLGHRPATRSWRRPWMRFWQRAVVAVLTAVGGASCSLDGLLKSDELPPNVSDPAITETPDGARAAYVGTLLHFRRTFGGFPADQASVIAQTGLLSDELTGNGSVDQRAMPEEASAASGTYSALQKVRGQAAQAIGLLATYVPDAPALRGHLYALQGYAEIFLADLFCSGIPLSTLDFGGDFTYKPGSSTEEVFTHAVALFDTALALSGDSTRFVQLAQIGRARGLLGMGAYVEAATAVTPILDSYHYDATFTSTTADNADNLRNFARLTTNTNNSFVEWNGLTVSDHEGSNGLDWRTSGDPRTQVTAKTGNASVTFYHPNKYAVDGSSPIVLASGIEARLIEAEAALQAGDAVTWLAKLNQLRQTAITPALPDTTDPGTEDARVDLLFRERAFWLFLTGQRQGDLRRLIRQYGREQSDIYPVGPYGPGGGIFPYGGDVTAPVPAGESVNPLFTGCASRGA